MPNSICPTPVGAGRGCNFKKRLLRSDLARLAGRLQVKRYAAGELIFRSREEQAFVAFPETGLASVQAVSLDGVSPTVAFVGREGAAGVMGALGGTVSMFETVAI